MIINKNKGYMDLSVKPKNLKQLEVSIEANLCYLGFGNDFLNTTSIVFHNKKYSYILAFIQIKKFIWKTL